MRTFTQYINEADERLESLKKYLATKGPLRGVDFSVEGKNYYATVKYKDYTAKFLFDNASYQKNSFYGDDELMHRIYSLTVSHKNKVIYNAVWHRYFTDILDYFSKAKMIFDKFDRKLIGVNIKDVEKEFKKLDNSYVVDLSTKFSMTSAGQTKSMIFYVFKPMTDANNVYNPHFGYEVECDGDKISAIKKKVFGFTDASRRRYDLPYNEIKMALDAFNTFKNFIKRTW